MSELTIIAATHGLKEVWISYQPVLAVMYLVQYMPTIGFWLMDKPFSAKFQGGSALSQLKDYRLCFFLQCTQIVTEAGFCVSLLRYALSFHSASDAIFRSSNSAE